MIFRSQEDETLSPSNGMRVTRSAHGALISSSMRSRVSFSTVSSGFRSELLTETAYLVESASAW